MLRARNPGARDQADPRGRAYRRSQKGAATRFLTLFKEETMEVSASSRKISVLVVDDEVDLCDVITFDLELSGYDAIAAYSGSEALSVLETRKVDFVLTDIRMPGL